MRDTECYQIARSLLMEIPGFVSNGKRLMFISPIGDVLRSFMFEGSPYSKDEFHFVWFFMPIVRPVDHIVLSYGDRLIGPSGVSWGVNMENLIYEMVKAMERESLAFLRSIHTRQDAIGAIINRAKFNKHLGITDKDNIACLLVLDGRFGEAKHFIEEIVEYENGDDRRSWILAIVERMKGLRLKSQRDPQLAVDQVRAWRQSTLEALKLDKWQ